jgi:hypothetical protein
LSARFFQGAQAQGNINPSDISDVIEHYAHAKKLL